MWIGVHYDYPFAGMTADRPKWKPIEFSGGF